jgi:hypothetical protein
MVDDGLVGDRAGGAEIGQPAQSVFGLKRESLVFESYVEGELVIVEGRDHDALGQGAGLEWIDAVRQPELRVPRRLVVGRVPILLGVAGGHTEARRGFWWSSRSPNPPRGPNSPVVASPTRSRYRRTTGCR